MTLEKNIIFEIYKDKVLIKDSIFDTGPYIIENVEPGPLEILFVNRLYGDSSTQINSPSISMLGAERFIEMNNDTFIKHNLSSYTVNLVQGVSTLQVKIKINNHLPNELIIAPLNRRGFRDIDTTKPYELIEVKNLEELSVN